MSEPIPVDPGVPEDTGVPVIEEAQSIWDKMLKLRPTKKGDDGVEVEVPPTPWELEKVGKTAAGWSLVPGYPVVFGENFVVGDYTYFAKLTGPPCQVWRIQTKDLP